MVLVNQWHPLFHLSLHAWKWHLKPRRRRFRGQTLVAQWVQAFAGFMLFGFIDHSRIHIFWQLFQSLQCEGQLSSKKRQHWNLPPMVELTATELFGTILFSITDKLTRIFWRLVIQIKETSRKRLCTSKCEHWHRPCLERDATTIHKEDYHA